MFQAFFNSKFARSIKIKFLLMILIILILEQIPILENIVFPFEQISTYFHEIGHCVTSAFFGGLPSQIKLYIGGGGYCRSFEPSFFPEVAIFSTLFFGHGGEIIFGFLLFFIANKSDFSMARNISQAVAIFIFVSVLLIRDLQSLGVIGCNALIFLMINKMEKETQAKLLLKFIGIYLIINSAKGVLIYYDFISLIFDGESVDPDPKKLAILTGFSELFWVKIWIIFSAIALIIAWILDQEYSQDEILGMKILLSDNSEFGQIIGSGAVLQVVTKDNKRYALKNDSTIFVSTNLDQAIIKTSLSREEFLKLCFEN